MKKKSLILMYSVHFRKMLQGHEVLSSVKRMGKGLSHAYLKGNSEDDKHFRHLVKRSGFRLLDFPEAGIRDALVVAVKEDKEVGYLLFISQFCS